MKKIRILKGFVIAVITVYLIKFIANIYLTMYPPAFMDFPEEFFQQFIFGYYTQFVKLFFSVFSFFALVYVYKGLVFTLKNGFFNKDSAVQLKMAGKLFLISGTLNLFWDFILLVYSKGELYFTALLDSDLLLLILGFVLLVIVDLINNGNVIEQENNLTI